MPETPSQSIEMTDELLSHVQTALMVEDAPEHYAGRSWWDWPTVEVAERIIKAAIDAGVVVPASGQEGSHGDAS